jgi:NAD-dependent deacetylase
MRFSRVVVLTGAGISAESGIRTFRASDGLWEDHAIEDVATPEGFARDPELVQRFYNERRRHLSRPEIRPNAAHLALADFEKQFPGDFLLVTQNVDNLHERAGSENVLHMHGSLLEARCLDTHEVFKWENDLGTQTPQPKTGAKGRLRPHIVWFGEMPLYVEQIQTALRQCDLFLSIGTSGQVYPAAGFVQMTARGCHRVELNLADTPIGPYFSEHIQGPASRCVPDYLRKILDAY